MLACDMPPVLVIDLDETILGVNSFPLWVWFLIGGWLPELGLRQRAWLSLQTQLALLRRKLGRIDHDEFRCGLQAAWHSAAGLRCELLTRRFQTRLLRHVRISVQPVLEIVAAGHVDAVLATAATADYATGLGQRLGFRHVLASLPYADGIARLNGGMRKRDRVLAFLRARGWHNRMLILFTDHPDDLPLIRDSNIVFWFGRDDALAVAQASAGDVDFVRCRDLDGETLLSALCALNAIPATQEDHPVDAARAMTAS
jgi:phosphoserine phosphatase